MNIFDEYLVKIWHYVMCMFGIMLRMCSKFGIKFCNNYQMYQVTTDCRLCIPVSNIKFNKPLFCIVNETEEKVFQIDGSTKKKFDLFFSLCKRLMYYICTKLHKNVNTCILRVISEIHVSEHLYITRKYSNGLTIDLNYLWVFFRVWNLKTFILRDIQRTSSFWGEYDFLIKI